MNNLMIKQIQSLIESESNIIANLSNISALLNDSLNDINWVGFYLLEDDTLILGPFQGHVACTRIKVGNGVCGTSVKERKTLRIENVHEFPGHIACDSASNSEIVVPLFKNNQVIGVLDIDSPSLNRFSTEDELLLNEAGKVIETIF